MLTKKLICEYCWEDIIFMENYLSEKFFRESTQKLSLLKTRQYLKARKKKFKRFTGWSDNQGIIIFQEIFYLENQTWILLVKC